MSFADCRDSPLCLEVDKFLFIMQKVENEQSLYDRYLYELPCTWNYIIWQCRIDYWSKKPNPRTWLGQNQCKGKSLYFDLVVPLIH